MDSGFWFEAGSVLPSLGVGLLFWIVMRAAMRADRHEREAEREAEQGDRELQGGDEQNHSVGTDVGIRVKSASPRLILGADGELTRVRTTSYHQTSEGEPLWHGRPTWSSSMTSAARPPMRR